MVHAAITASVGFLIAVLWFDLMFAVQLIGRRGDKHDTDAAVDSIATYYRRVTTDASPMGRLVGLVMLALLILLVVQATRAGTPVASAAMATWQVVDRHQSTFVCC